MFPSLFRAWLRLLIVWWAAATLWWMLSDERIAQSASQLMGSTQTVDATNALPTVFKLLMSWTLPVAAFCIAALCFGIWAAWLLIKTRQWLARQRIKATPSSAWRRISTNMGSLELPRWATVPSVDLEIQPKGHLAARLKGMNVAQTRLFMQILERLAAAPDAFVGDGHVGTLLDHTWHVISQLPADCQDPLLLIAAAGHDAGKLLSHTRTVIKTTDAQGHVTETVKYVANRGYKHDDLGGLIVSACPAFEQLAENEQRILLLLLRFAHKRSKTPILPERADQIRLSNLQTALKSADGMATAAEKAVVLEKIDKDDLLKRAFIQALPGLPFQIAGTKKGVKAIGWRKDSRVYFSEWGLREALTPAIASLDPDAAAAWNQGRSAGKLAQQTVDLINMLKAEGWLIDTINGIQAVPPLWNIRSGNLDINGVLLVELPGELLAKLPSNAPYQITIVGAISGASFDQEHPPYEAKSKDSTESTNKVPIVTGISDRLPLTLPDEKMDAEPSAPTPQAEPTVTAETPAAIEPQAQPQVPMTPVEDAPAPPQPDAAAPPAKTAVPPTPPPVPKPAPAKQKRAKAAGRADKPKRNDHRLSASQRKAADMERLMATPIAARMANAMQALNASSPRTDNDAPKVAEQPPNISHKTEPTVKTAEPENPRLAMLMQRAAADTVNQTTEDADEDLF
ncbi:hypothetical protein [Sinimarinibacterium sp. NLF-5-8]|uniref:hypothetical protein n=1 Tax=Sinimarinibacterium sp. NLF-5-8 TaxID=2698684 RepID=UPI00137BE20D|nr:hypothetical protein [Sinimarinibacterium sp. NLF-5-8]QHS08995.1 hypothetical protein GT972_01790 [Sinimarinibacterium sp. NLF-5-8]